MSVRGVMVAAALLGVGLVAVGREGAGGREDEGKRVASKDGSRGGAPSRRERGGGGGGVGAVSPTSERDKKSVPSPVDRPDTITAKTNVPKPRPLRHRAVDPPVAPPPNRSRYHCSQTYCDDSGQCFSPSPPNCIP